MNHKHYTYQVIWSEEDGEYVGLCAEFPSLSYIDEDQAAALSGVANLINQILEDIAANGEGSDCGIISSD